MQKLLVTGGAGFIGSHCIQLFLKKYPDYYIVNLDKLTYAARIAFALQEQPNYYFVEGDITDFALVWALFQKFNFDGVIHFAAESHVDRSIIDPLLFIKTNIEGTGVLLHAAYSHWFKAASQPRNPNHRFVYISTDEVYGALDDHNKQFTETDALAPSNPYSASKAAGECLVSAYAHTYGLHTVITRSTNNYGRYQYPEKLIPMVLKNALQAQPIPLHGDGSSIRDWLHVEDHCRAIDCIFHKGQIGQSYNIGANEEWTNLEITWMICQILDRLKPLSGRSYTSFIRFTTERIGQDRRYALDCTKIKETLGWAPSIALQEGIEHLVRSEIEQD
ncbi:MAG: dTDP-glucose 4,6-dehydratase [Candidatus Cardinium sp.]|uniref:dTDP-glucose 4,6-dehydratase n=1 Tax=Cardinium endosymbiont of Dermatophagoides farinae TaxID=2597823 RepID=UPI0011831D97|nr:dTDP-glucose 4,6-dehydratase [Cardinium endosymbiont of Dermatophagoides farinae]TSJ80765.1 dTDP-glucose 4,6-dehydratase [Cardinium endosymbiont of Dermatophagoides farinae]UWW96766.1 MAG: dTDP-glucose 4,6-dehydratase [Candidatus Cardinium sp.]